MTRRRAGFGCVELVALLDYRGAQELGALARAYVNRAWRWRLDPQWRGRVARAIPRNVIRFGGAVKS